MKMRSLFLPLLRKVFGHMRDPERARELMVERQLKRRGVDDPRVLEAMGKVPRHKFMPADVRARAYDDSAVPIGEGQTISQPYMVALMTQELHVRDTCRVLEIGTGSGYQCAVLAELAEHVYTVERIPSLTERARAVLEVELGYTNISFRVGDGTLGWPEEAPFDRIMVTAAAPGAPQPLLSQLAPGGEMVAPVGTQYMQMLTRYRRGEQGRVDSEEICQCVFVKLVGEGGWEG